MVKKSVGVKIAEGVSEYNNINDTVWIDACCTLADEIDIKLEDAKKEGFKNKKEFIKTFYKINTLHHPSEVVFGIWNPEVWVLSFSKVVD